MPSVSQYYPDPGAESPVHGQPSCSKGASPACRFLPTINCHCVLRLPGASVSSHSKKTFIFPSPKPFVHLVLASSILHLGQPVLGLAFCVASERCLRRPRCRS